MVISDMRVAAVLVTRGVSPLPQNISQPFVFAHANVGVFSEYMATCLCLRGTSTPFSIIHPKSQADISKSEIDSVTFGFLCVISDDFIARINSCLHIMGSRSSVSPIHTPLQPYPDASTNVIYSGFPGIGSVHFVGSKAASCSS